MISRLLPERARHNLVQTHRAIQSVTWAVSLAFVLIAVFADPGYHLAFAAADAAASLFTLILR